MASGATHHMTGRIEAFHSIRPSDIQVEICDGSFLRVHGQGKVWLKADLDGRESRTLCLKDVYYIRDSCTQDEPILA